VQNESIDLELRVGRFKIGVTTTVIGQIPSTGSVEELFDDQGLNAARTHGKYRLSRGRNRHCEYRRESRDYANVRNAMAKS
jgi:hypothetical protein